VVLAMLTLFAVIGLTFVYYAGSLADRARIEREGHSVSQPDLDPELLLSLFLGQLLYDVPDDESGVYSALRGHSLARSLYGFNDTGANVVPFNGTGRLHQPSPFGAEGPDDFNLVNYTFFRDDSQLPQAQRFLRDPERLGTRPGLNSPRGPFTGGFNAPYTYPDLNNLFLAAVKADGTVLLPSYHRPWLFGSNDPSNPNWANAAGKYLLLRPRPADMGPGFPYPDDEGGDVKNLIGSPGGNDSYWIDLGAPVLTAPDGRKFKPLFAPLVVDLDGRLNLNVHGNLLGSGQTHASNQGWGPWEVNLGRVLSRGGGTEWRNLLQGSTNPPAPGRYGGKPWAGKPGTPGLPGASAPAGPTPHFYSQVDFDGRNEQTGGPSGRLLLPGFGAPPLSCFPSFLTPAGGSAGYGNRSAAERQGHPLLQDPFRPVGDDRAFAVWNLEALLRQGDTGSEALASELARLCPSNFADPRIRRMVTTHSFDLDRPGVIPWVFNPADSPYEAPPTTDPDQPAVPEGRPIAFPPLTERVPRSNNGEFGAADWRALSASLARINLNRPLPPYPHQGSGKTPPFGPPLTVLNGWVALDVRFDVDAPNGPIWKQFVLAQEARQRLANDIYRRLLAVTGVAPILPDQNPQVPSAELLRPRRWLAQLAANLVDYIDEDDISTPFNFYTAEDYGHLPVPPPLPPDPDRVDPTRRADGPNGEIQWPLYWVFGTELPRVVVNEALAEMRVNAPDGAYGDTVRVFVELHQTFPRSVPPGVQQTDAFPVPLRVSAGTVAHTPYRVMIGVKSPVPGRQAGSAILPGTENNNVLGNPELAAVRAATTDADFLPPLATIGNGQQPSWPGSQGGLPYGEIPSPYVPAHGPDDGTSPQGFLLLGPPQAAPDPFPARDPFAAANNALIPPPTPVLRTANLQYSRSFLVRQPGETPDERSEGVTVLLRRLANPYLPFDGKRRLASGIAPNFTYNPYVTVDYLEDIPVQPVAVRSLPVITSTGKLQPYAAHRSQLRPQTTAPNPGLKCSFGRENVPAPERYDWLVHLDRQPVSPLELSHVSGYQPYQLTQRFVGTDGAGQPVKFGHRAPWLDEGRSPGAPSHRLYRLFEFLEAGASSAGVAPGGRSPGKINLNTVWDPEVFQALCDAQPSNYFRESDVEAVFTALLYDPLGRSTEPYRRTQGLTPDADDRPLQGLAVGTYPASDGPLRGDGGVEDSFLRLQPAASGVHPYLDRELLTKIFNQVTVRSNVFAVWLTVGFFEVTDDTVRPVKLGAEIGRAEGRNVRHRMFAIIDRTNLSVASCVTSLAQPLAAAPGARQTVAVNALGGTTPLPLGGPDVRWGIRAGTRLVVDTGANQEAVEVLAVNPGVPRPTITAVFTRPHPAGAPISLADTPGAPPVFLKPVAVRGPDPVPVPPYAPQPPYPLTVTVEVDPSRSNATTLAGSYDGIPWHIRPGTKLLIDVGPDQEVVTVPPGPFVMSPATATGSFRVIVNRPHADGFLITNTLLGNPGPQPRFDPRSPDFSAVVRYLSVIQ
jgi:hypothetical protein